jgi:hypothetical protein
MVGVNCNSENEGEAKQGWGTGAAMQLQCPHCLQILEFFKQQPRYCSECGKALFSLPLEPTIFYESQHDELESTQQYPPGPGNPTRAAPESVGGYRLLRPIGRGGMGTVYEAEERSTHRRVALKLIRYEFSASKDALERFRREGRLASAIVHPRCVFVLAADEEHGRPYIVMELMPGETLADRVARRGPMASWEAVTLILDVIEGLQEAHRCGLIHRDVKPSNCFLDAEGRVKIGDFGLAKSLVQQGALTQSGSFLGTVLFASPEQIRNDKVDRQADVYSAAATLYFLLTGKGPFETDDPAATLARTMSDPLTPLRQLRPDLPRTLDEVIQRGLARAREHRWQGLEEFRLALLPFVPGAHAVGEIGWRFAAYIIDSFVLVCLELTLLSVLVSLLGLPKATVRVMGVAIFDMFLSLAVYFAWFGLPEKVWGCSVGKYLFRMRVRGVRSDDRPTWSESLLRTAFFWLLKDGPFRLLNGLVLHYLLDRTTLPFTILLIVLPELARIAGVGLIASTMRRRNGFRGLHEFLSGTKVIQLPVPKAETLLRGPANAAPLLPTAGELPEKIGAFTVRGALRVDATEQVLIGVDEVLDRQVWLWLRPVDESGFQARRREISRTTRPRWLAGGLEAGYLWDAYVASPGWLLGDLVRGRGRLFWPEVRPVLEQLAEELSQACAEGTLPPSLGVGQIWVQNTGRVQLLDTPLSGPAESTSCAEDQQCALNLLKQAAVLLLEGRPRPPGVKPRPIRAPVPMYASELLARLSGVAKPFRKVQEFQVELTGVRDRPPTVGRVRRSVSLVVQAAALSLGVGFMLTLSVLLIQVMFLATFLFPGVLGQIALEDLHQEIVQKEVLLAAGPDPGVESALDGDMQAEARLRADLSFVLNRREVVLASSSWFVHDAVETLDEKLRNALRFQVHSIKGPQKIDESLPEITPDARQNAATVHQVLAEQRLAWKEDGWHDAVQAAALLLVWPVMWVFWAGVTRGGFSLPLSGIAVVQADGRKAARWRCVSRALLIWVPFAGLVLASLLLDMWRVGSANALAVSTVPTRSSPELVAAAWAAWLAWWLAVAWLPLHFLLVFRSPAQSWHDRLSGTFLVPR